LRNGYREILPVTLWIKNISEKNVQEKEIVGGQEGRGPVLIL